VSPAWFAFSRLFVKPNENSLITIGYYAFSFWDILIVSSALHEGQLTIGFLRLVGVVQVVEAHSLDSLNFEQPISFAMTPAR
jgi:hypothetical protein